MKVGNYYGEEASEKILEGTHKNAFDFVDEKTRGLDDYIAMTYFGNEISYNEFKKEVYKYANKLKSYGLESKDTISLVLPNVPEVVYYKYAAWLLGIRTTLIDPRVSPHEIKTAVEDTDSKLLVSILDVFKDKISPIIKDLKVENIILTTPVESMKHDLKGVIARNIYNYKEFLMYKQEQNFRDNRVILNKKFIKDANNSKLNSVYFENMTAAITFTSGTTGTPKRPMHSHDSYNIKVNQLLYVFPPVNGATFLAIIPFFSAYGSFTGMHNQLCRGMNMIMIPKSKPDEFPELICKYKINNSMGVPKYWEDFKNNCDKNMEKYKLEDLSFMKYVFAGGDESQVQAINEFNEMLKKHNTNARYIVGYGSTETAGAVTSMPDEDKNYVPNSIGMFLPGIDYLFIDPETKEIVEDVNHGELCINDPAMMDGYLNDEKATNEITYYHNGKKYYRMGDLFEIDDNGVVYFKGRTKRTMMRPDGHTVHSHPIEEVLMQHKDVDSVCVVGVKKKDNSAGSIPTAFVMLKDGVSPSEELTIELDNMTLEKLSERNRALAYTYIKQMPYNGMMKIDYKELEKNKLEDLDLYVVDNIFMPTHKLIRNKKN